MNNKSFIPYKNRQERAQFTVTNFGMYIEESEKILDVGCWENDFKKAVGNKVTGIDIAGDPDIQYDLEKKISIVGDNSYDLVICTDVMEHINNLHQLLGELIRMSRKYIIISLPNNLTVFQRITLLKGRTSKFYGLPPEPPEDRHRWFFSYKEAENLIRNEAEKNNLYIRESFPHYNYFNSLRGRAVKFMIKTGLLGNPNLFAQTYWVVLEKR